MNYNRFIERMAEQIKEEKVEQLKEKNKIKCIHNIVDGAGNYCKLKPMDNENYPHKFCRTDCYGRKHNCKFIELYKENKKLGK